MSEIAAIVLCSLGALFWFTGSLWLFTSRPVLVKIHYLGIADTYGSLLIIAGLIIHAESAHHLLLLAAASCVCWGAGLSAVVAHRIFEGNADE